MVRTVEIGKPQDGPQKISFGINCDVLIYGGQAGGGKSWMLVNKPLNSVHIKGFYGAIFRRTFPQLKGQGGVWDECQEPYRALGARMREGQELDATFPSGANIAFRHLQHEKTIYDYQGHQFAYLGFDELTHFTATQFFYLLGRNRSTCGVKPYVRATCNPQPGWVADFLEWWIDQDTGLGIPERSGVVRFFIRNGDSDEIIWGDSKEELIDQFPEYSPEDILSCTFVMATLEDNKILNKKDPGYRGKLMALSRIERNRLLGGNWKIAEGVQIDQDWIKRYTINDKGQFCFAFQNATFAVPAVQMRRIATIDTAGTSKEKAAKERGAEPSWTVCGIWDYIPFYVADWNNSPFKLFEMMFLRYIWRAQVDWNQLKSGIQETLDVWSPAKTYIENAHHGQPLKAELKGHPCELIGPVLPGMADGTEGAKLERAIASGMLQRFEHGKIFIPMQAVNMVVPDRIASDEGNQAHCLNKDPLWLRNFLRETSMWTGKPNEVADQIDMISYAVYVAKRSSGSWGGVIKK